MLLPASRLRRAREAARMRTFRKEPPLGTPLRTTLNREAEHLCQKTCRRPGTVAWRQRLRSAHDLLHLTDDAPLGSWALGRHSDG